MPPSQAKSKRDSGSRQDAASDQGGLLDILRKDSLSRKSDKLLELEAERDKLREEVKELEDKARACELRKNMSGRNEICTWILIEYNNYGCDKFLEGLSIVPHQWAVLVFYNRNATNIPRSSPAGVQLTIKSQQGGSVKKVKDERVLSYSLADLCFTVGDIALRAVRKGINTCTTVYFVLSLSNECDKAKLQPQQALLEKMGIRSFFIDGHAHISDIMAKEGLNRQQYVKLSHPDQELGQRSRSKSRGR